MPGLRTSLQGRASLPALLTLGGGVMGQGGGGPVTPLGPTSASYTAGATPGSIIATITGLQAGESISSVTPNDGRLALAAGGTQLVAGLSASSAGTINAVLTSSTGRTLNMALTVNAPVGLPVTFVTAENRIFNTQEARGGVTGGVNWYTRTLHTVGSGAVKDLTVLLDGWFSAAGGGYTALSNAFTITKMSFEIVGNAVLPMTFGGGRSITVNPGDLNVEGDYKSASAIASALSSLPIGTEFWVKAEGTVPTTAGSMPACQRNSADATGTQFGWYNAANTTMVNGTDNAGAYTFTGTAPDTRNSGWAPQIVGHFIDGPMPVVEYFLGNSITQGLQDATPKRTGRGWPQYVLAGDGSNSPSTGIRAGFNAGVSGQTASAQNNNGAQILSKMKYCTDAVVASGTNDLGQAGGGDPTTIHNSRMSLIDKLTTVASVAGNRAPRFLVPQLQPQSTTGNPTKAINSAPNTNWGTMEKSYQIDLAMKNAAAASGGKITFVAIPSIRQSANDNVVEGYLWKYNPASTGNVYDTLMTPDGQHPGNAGVIAWAGDFGPAYRSQS